MKIKAVSGIMLTLLLVSMLTLAFNIQPTKSEPTTWTVDDDGPADFSSVQEAINAASPGDTIFVSSGTYYETPVYKKYDGVTLGFVCVLITKSNLTLIGEDRDTTIIDGGLNGTVLFLVASNCVISGFTMQNSGIWKCGVFLWKYGGNTIVNNNISTNDSGIEFSASDNNTLINNAIKSNSRGGIFVGHSDNNKISNNTINLNGVGISLDSSNYNSIANNTVSNNDNGIKLSSSYSNVVINNNLTFNNNDGLYETGSSDNEISNNIVSMNDWGIRMYSGPHRIIGNKVSRNNCGIYVLYSNNTIYDNSVANNNVGISFFESNDNIIYHNNFINNTEQVSNIHFAHIWDDGYPSGGNFWSDYTGVDVKSGPYQDETGSDGIGDMPYIIDADNQDNYPLMSPWGDVKPPIADAGSDLTITVGTTVTFDGSKSIDDVAIKSYVWTFTDITPQTLTGMQPKYAFNNIGDFEVALNVSDYAGNWNTDTVTITMLPTISVISPENRTYSAEDVPLTFTVDEATSWTGYSLDGQANVTIIGNTTLSGLSDGSHSLIVYAKDTAGNIRASEIIYFSIETQQAEPLQLWIVATIVIIAVFGTALLVYFLKKHACMLL